MSWPGELWLYVDGDWTPSAGIWALRPYRDEDDTPNANDGKVADIEMITLNNGVELPAVGLGVFQTPPDETRGRRPGGAGHGVPPHRHRGCLRERATGRRGGALPPIWTGQRSSWKPRSGSATTATTRRGMRSTRAPGKLGVDRIDLLILHQALPSAFDRTLAAYRALETLLADGKVRAIGVSNFMVEHLPDAARPRDGRAGRQPDRGPPLRRAARSGRPSVPSTANSPRRGHRSAASPFIATANMAARSTTRSSAAVARGARQDCGPSDAALGSAARALGDPQVQGARPGVAENIDLFDFRLAANEMTAIDNLDTGVRGGPEPNAITLEAFGREIRENRFRS